MKIRALVKSRLFGLIGGLVSLLVVVSLSRSVLGLWSKRSYVEERKAVLVAQQKENDRLKKDLVEVQKPEFIEKEARERLGMAREWETIVIMSNDKLPMSNGKTEEKTSESISNWKKWWRLFF